MLGNFDGRRMAGPAALRESNTQYTNKVTTFRNQKELNVPDLGQQSHFGNMFDNSVACSGQVPSKKPKMMVKLTQNSNV